MNRGFDPDLYRIIKTAYEDGRKSVLMDKGYITAYVSKKEAYRMYGKGTVERWIEEGRIHVEKDGENTSKCRISRESLSIAASTSDRPSWFQNKYR